MTTVHVLCWVATAYVAACLLIWLWSLIRAPGFKVAGRHVLITGGGSGLGLALAKIYARAGAKVTILGRDLAKLEAAKRQIESSSGSDREELAPVFAYSCDVTNYAATQAAVAAANAFHQRVTDHVICNAANSTPGLLLDQHPDGFRHIMDVNYFGVLHTIKAALPAMLATPLASTEPRRRIVFVSSGAGLISFAGYSQYSSSKFAMRGLAECMRNELQLYGIETTIFYPGNFDTPLLQADQEMKPEVTKLAVALSVPRSPDAVAKSLARGIARGWFAFTNELALEPARILSSGIGPRANPLIDILLFPFCVIIASGYVQFIDSIVRKRAVVG